MKMTIVRAKEPDFESDLDVVTEIAHIERDNDMPNSPEEEFVTIYGTIENKELYYIILDKEAIELLREKIS